MMVANKIPKPSEIAIGIMKRAWREVSKIIGANPPKVVKVVSKIARKRAMPACWIAIAGDAPSSR